ncbi:MAG: hypothetical protein BZY88_02020 [SAR202 cluster bacterium Io17-Chloro-G9]|nr:MAG: hypothetical protein BZY88_02020 [SAR202 cluster bacterium Io17-Chloro-G9]
MSLDLGETVTQLDQLATQIGNVRTDRTGRLEAFLAAASQIDAPTAREKTGFEPGRPFLAAQVVDALTGSYSPTAPPPDWCVASVDGSHIDVDRHLPVSCYLVNLGGCRLTYGSQPDAQFFSSPHLATDPGDMYLTNPANPSQEEAVTGPLLGLVRTIRELERLVQMVEECPPDLPVLALIDGSLVLWGLSGQGYRPFVRDAIIGQGLLAALDRLRELSQRRLVTLAAYVSLPRSTEVVNAARSCFCTQDPLLCRESCSNRRSVHAPCNMANDILDRDMFQALLSPGFRSPLYLTNSSVSRESYGEHQVYFYYIHGETEIGRVEVPKWVAEDENLLALNHSLILDQCRRGQGYPVAISEAHEQAVVRTGDRQIFKEMVSQALEQQGLPAYTSEKERSKRTPWV